jgi:quinoprotein relay system zinc metallohydrolase 2
MVCTVAQSVAAESEKPAHTIFSEVADGTYVRLGKHYPVTFNLIDRISNHGFIIGTDSVAVVDTGGSTQQAISTIHAIRELTSLPISDVVVTHVHPDHILGLNAYVDLSGQNPPKIHGHRRLSERYLNNLDFFAENFASDNALESLGREIAAGLISPVIDEKTINLGERQLKLLSFPVAHSRSDIAIIEKTSGILWSGDLLFVDRIPALDGSIKGWIKAVEKINELQPTLVIPGHGRVGLWDALHKPQSEYLNGLLTNTHAAIRDGLSLQQFVDQSSRSVSTNFDSSPITEQTHKSNLARAFTELEWEE